MEYTLKTIVYPKMNIYTIHDGTHYVYGGKDQEEVAKRLDMLKRLPEKNQISYLKTLRDDYAQKIEKPKAKAKTQLTFISPFAKENI